MSTLGEAFNYINHQFPKDGIQILALSLCINWPNPHIHRHVEKHIIGEVKIMVFSYVSEVKITI
jgi:hypothetical protein